MNPEIPTNESARESTTAMVGQASSELDPTKNRTPPARVVSTYRIDMGEIQLLEQKRGTLLRKFDFNKAELSTLHPEFKVRFNNYIKWKVLKYVIELVPFAPLLASSGLIGSARCSDPYKHFSNDPDKLLEMVQSMESLQIDSTRKIITGNMNPDGEQGKFRYVEDSPDLRFSNAGTAVLMVQGQPPKGGVAKFTAYAVVSIEFEGIMGANTGTEVETSTFTTKASSPKVTAQPLALTLDIDTTSSSGDAGKIPEQAIGLLDANKVFRFTHTVTKGDDTEPTDQVMQEFQLANAVIVDKKMQITIPLDQRDYQTELIIPHTHAIKGWDEKRDFNFLYQVDTVVKPHRPRCNLSQSRDLFTDLLLTAPITASAARIARNSAVARYHSKE